MGEGRGYSPAILGLGLVPPTLVATAKSQSRGNCLPWGLIAQLGTICGRNQGVAKADICTGWIVLEILAQLLFL